MPKDALIKQQVKDYLDALGKVCWYREFDKKDDLDFIICYRGFFWGIITKDEADTLDSARQEHKIMAIAATGGLGSRCVGVEQVQYWVNQCDAKCERLKLI